jgi:hypothetical protein
MSKAKRHHFVPQMLLRSFAPAGEPEKIWQLGVNDDSEPVRVAISDAAVVKHYYTHFRDRPHKEDDLFWEELFAEWEGNAANALRKLATDPNHIRGPAQALIFLQLMRTPLGQAQIAAQAEAERRQVFGNPDGRVWTRWVLERTGRVPTPAEWLALRDASDAARGDEAHPLLQADATVILDEMMTVLTKSGFGERLDGGYWNILWADPDRFVIGDEPVTYCGQSEPARPIWSQGELPEQLTMPIAPDRAIEVRRSPRARVYMDDQEVEEINLRAAEWATRFIYGSAPQLLTEVRSRWEERRAKTPPPVRASDRRRR